MIGIGHSQRHGIKHDRRFIRCSALEPVISAEIMELHHSKHHQAYVNGYNAAFEKFQEVHLFPSGST